LSGVMCYGIRKSNMQLSKIENFHWIHTSLQWTDAKIL
jgi:hypothetical protein